MTLAQIQYLRENFNKDDGTGKPVANSVFYDLDNNIAFRNNGDFVIFDDTNQLIHCISANRNNFVKHETPYCLMSAPYEFLQYTEANLTLEGLYKLLDDMFYDLTDDQKDMIKEWAEDLPVKPLQGVNDTYFTDPAPKVPQKPITPITREDGVSNGYPITAESHGAKE